MNITVQDTLQNSPLNSCLESNCSTKISISQQEARLGNLNLNAVTLGNIWRKAERLLSNSNFIKEKPFLVSSQQFFVYSFSIDEPYTVNTSSDLVACNCPMYKTSPKICSHAIACAEKVGKISTYLQLVSKRVSCGSDPTGLALSVRGINKKSSGCKGGKSKYVGTKHKGSEIVNYVPAPFLDNQRAKCSIRIVNACTATIMPYYQQSVKCICFSICSFSIKET